MNLNQKKGNIEFVRDHIGWAYRSVKVLTVGNAKQATKDRNQLLNYCLSRGCQTYKGNLSKVYTGHLSPGCETCAQGSWSCLFLNRRCTRNCFFCPQDKKRNNTFCPTEGNYGIAFRFPGEYARFIKALHYKGVGITGGEPFLDFDCLLKYIKIIKKSCDSKIYIWLYTNGDLVSKKNLKTLSDLGLNELRFDLSARNYDLSPVELAVKYIDRVTVEIPAIPEDFKAVKSILRSLQKIGVRHLNLHQLFFNEQNQHEFVKRGYTLLHHLKHPPYPVFESEMTALQLIKYALDNRIQLSINYCSSIYKSRFQNRGLRQCLAKLFLSERDNYRNIYSVTSAGYLRKICVRSSPQTILNLKGAIKAKTGCDAYCDPNDSKKLFFPFNLLESSILNKFALTIEYYECAGLNKIKQRSSGLSWITKDNCVGVLTLPNRIARLLFTKLYIELKDCSQAALEVADIYQLDSKRILKLKRQVNQFDKNFECFERLPSWLPECY